MPQLAIHLINWAVLVIVLVGFPAVASLRFFSLQVTAANIAQTLMLAGFAVASFGNAAVAYLFIRKRRLQRACYTWALIHAALLGFLYLFFNDIVDFQWLKDALLWLKRQT